MLYIVQVGMNSINGNVIPDGLDDGSLNVIRTGKFFKPFKNDRDGAQ